MDIQENVPLSSLTTFRTGGPARFLITLDSKEEIPEALAFSEEQGMPFIPLGGGSNMLAPDEGRNAVFVKLSAADIAVVESGEQCAYIAHAGASWDALVASAVAHGLWGVENLSAIPGTAGAAAVQNIGAYGAALSDTVHAVEAYDTKTRALKIFTANECKFGYRTSIFKEERDRYFITEITLHLSRTPKPNLSYRDLKTRFADSPQPALSSIRDAVIEIRKGKFPPLSEYGTAGSFFLNPLITEKESSALAAQYPGMPFFTMPEGGVKVPLAWIFDHVLSLKGMREGKAFVWEKQPLVLAAEFGARSKDVVLLAERITRIAKEKTGIELSPEVRIEF